MNPIVSLVFAVICTMVAAISIYRLIHHKTQKARLREQEEKSEETKEAQ